MSSPDSRMSRAEEGQDPKYYFKSCFWRHTKCLFVEKRWLHRLHVVEEVVEKQENFVGFMRKVQQVCYIGLLCEVVSYLQHVDLPFATAHGESERNY